MITLHVEPKTVPMKRADFERMSPTHSISLDGFVRGQSWYEPKGPRANFDHHEDVSRSATRATCEQILIAIRQDMFRDAFVLNGQPHAHVFVLDCDEDICLAVWLLRNSHLVENTMEPRINKLVGVAGLLDASGGTYPFPAQLPFLRKLAWLFEPYRQFRGSGRLKERNADEFRAVIDNVGLRISRYYAGQDTDEDERGIDLRFERVGGNSVWAMINEIGAHARTGLYADGIKAFVSVKPHPKGGYAYIIGRVSPYIAFDVPLLLQKLNEAEGLSETSDRWGGSDTIGGGPYGGSRLLPQEVQRVINETLHI